MYFIVWRINFEIKVWQVNRDETGGIFSEISRLSYLSSMGDPLEMVSWSVDFELFRSILNEVFRKESAGAGGRPPWD